MRGGSKSFLWTTELHATVLWVNWVTLLFYRAALTAILETSMPFNRCFLRFVYESRYSHHWYHFCRWTALFVLMKLINLFMKNRYGNGEIRINLTREWECFRNVRYANANWSYHESSNHTFFVMSILHRGLYRVHQFSKVEMFIFCRPEESEHYHEELITMEEDLFSSLGLHYKWVTSSLNLQHNLFISFCWDSEIFWQNIGYGLWRFRCPCSSKIWCGSMDARLRTVWRGIFVLTHQLSWMHP